MHALNTWYGIVSALLFAAAVALAAVEFLGGPELNRKMRGLLEDWWLKASYIRPPEFGEREARFALKLLTDIFGKTAFSIKRLTVSAVTVLLIFAVVSAVIPADFDVQELADFLKYEFVVLAVTIWLSITLTQQILLQSVVRFSRKAYAGIWFLGTLILSVLATNFFTGRFYWLVSQVIFLAAHDGRPVVPREVIAKIVVAAVVAPFSPEAHMPGIADTIAAARDSEIPFAIAYITQIAVADVLSWLRLGIALASVVWWLSGFAFRGLSLALYRFSQTEKGALTIFAALIASLATFVNWLFAR